TTDSPAIQFLEGLLSDGNNNTTTTLSSATPQLKPARVPPPSQIALLNSLIIHPSYTSRAFGANNLHVAAQSLAYLRDLLSVVGPVNANLRAAFTFGNSSSGSGRSTRPPPDSDEYDKDGGGWSSSSSTSASDLIESKLAREHSIWRRASDFWAALGWAFRCAAAHPQRWRHWKVWLEYMVDVLEADWDGRLEMEDDNNNNNNNNNDDDDDDDDNDNDNEEEGEGKESWYASLRQSLLAGYLGDLRRERKNTLREVLRALMAFVDDDDGSDRVVFKEVFEGEAVVVGSDSKGKRKRAPTVDLEKGEFGDYLDGDNGGPKNVATGRRRGKPPKTAAAAAAAGMSKKSSPTTNGTGTDTATGFAFRVSDSMAETVPLRLRLFRLLSAASFYIPDVFTPVGDLYEQFADRVRSLPLPMFRLFIASHATPLPDFAHVSLLRGMIDKMLPSSGGSGGRPSPASADPEVDAKAGVSVPMMEKCFLPFAAGRVTVEENAKLSLVLENMLWYIYGYRDVVIPYTKGLRMAVEKGIRAREDKVKRRGVGGGDGQQAAVDRAAREVLDRSARSLRLLVDVVEAQDS
ncbi:hypothetical protein B0T17DRAFT_494536, partial [Bombardia bombarda]